MSFLFIKVIFANIEFESSQQQDFKDTPIASREHTRENESNSNCIFEEVRRPISVKLTQPKSRHNRECYHRRKPCGISLMRYL